MNRVSLWSLESTNRINVKLKITIMQNPTFVGATSHNYSKSCYIGIFLMFSIPFSLHIITVLFSLQHLRTISEIIRLTWRSARYLIIIPNGHKFLTAWKYSSKCKSKARARWEIIQRIRTSLCSIYLHTRNWCVGAQRENKNNVWSYLATWYNWWRTRKSDSNRCWVNGTNHRLLNFRSWYCRYEVECRLMFSKPISVNISPC